MIPSIKELIQHSQFQANQNEKKLFKAKGKRLLIITMEELLNTQALTLISHIKYLLQM